MIELHKKYGCLTVLDLGEEYEKTDSFQKAVNRRKEIRDLVLYFSSVTDTDTKRNLLSQYMNDNVPFRSTDFVFDRLIRDYNSELEYLDSIIEKHYKCQCKCGRVHHYNEETIEAKPRFCFYPVPIATSFTYSTKAYNARWHKMAKYSNRENVKLLDKSGCIPSDDFCDLYNKEQRKKQEKKEEEYRTELAKHPRVFAQNYDKDFTGMQYESLFIEECSDENFEYTYTLKALQQRISPITVYKRYKCKCVLCGEEQYITCDKFGIDEQGNSSVHCSCRFPSKSEWKVTKLLIDNKIPYQVQYSFPDLYGYWGKNLLTFDFAIFNTDGSLKCLIECQGKQHYESVDWFGGEYTYQDQLKNDAKKSNYVKAHSIQLIEISYKDSTINKIEEVLKKNQIIPE